MLPSRAADNLFWLGRYVERVETAVRLLRAYHLRLAESDTPNRPLLAVLAKYLAAQGYDVEAPFAPVLMQRVGMAQICANKVRDRFSVDGWIALNDLAETVEAMDGLDQRADDAARAMGLLLRQIAGFSGLVHENMYRFTGWRFLTLGRALERANSMAWTLALFADPAKPDGALDIAVEVGDSLMTHRRRYAVATTRNTVIDLLALDSRNPRSILYQLDEVRTQIAMLPGNQGPGLMTPLARRVLKAHTGLAVLSPEEISTMDLVRLRDETAALAALVSETYLG